MEFKERESKTACLRTYRELAELRSFKDRYEYLRLSGNVGEITFGFDRWINQQLYRSSNWRRAKDRVIIRDGGCDLGLPGYELSSRLVVHHMNPLTPRQIELAGPEVFDPEFLICCSFDTHNAIHFGDESKLPQVPITRRRGDTIPWR